MQNAVYINSAQSNEQILIITSNTKFNKQACAIKNIYNYNLVLNNSF